ncbi:MAG TPA: GNAT family N-acetyltransferase [Methylomirabilota bacterium]
MESLTLSADIGLARARYLELEQAASRPYGRFVYGSDAIHAAVHAYLLDSGAAEFSPPDGKLALADTEVVGMLAALSGAALGHRRLQSAYRIARSPFVAADTDLTRRIRLASETLLRPDPDDLYVSRIAVAPTARGRGIGAAMLERLLREARAAGMRRCVVEVAPGNAAALALYARHGFVQVDARSVTDARTGRALAYIHMLCTLGA